MEAAVSSSASRDVENTSNSDGSGGECGADEAPVGDRPDSSDPNACKLSPEWVSILEVVSAAAVIVCIADVVIGSLPAMQSHSVDIVRRDLDLSLAAFFIAEYVFRCCMAKRICVYLRSGFGIVDGITAVSSFFDLVFPWSFKNWQGGPWLLLQWLRIFRVVKLLKHVGEARMITTSIRQQARLILVFLLFVSISVLFLGTLLFAVEEGNPGFTSIPDAMWWAVVTLTTVGYGDMVPHSFLGRTFASAAMMLAYGMLAVPTILSLSGRELSLAPPSASAAWHRGPAAQQAGGTAAGAPDALPASLFMRACYPHFVSLPTPPCSNDPNGHVSSAACYSLIDAAVCRFIAKAAPWDFLAQGGQRAVVVESSCRFLAPLVFPESVDVGVTVEAIDQSSCTYRVGLFAEAADAPRALGRLVHVWTDPSYRRTGEMPAAVRIACEKIRAALPVA